MKTLNFASKVTVNILLPSVILALMIAHPVVAQDTRSMTVLGSIDGTADGTERSWLTISGEVDGKMMSSAAWRPYSMMNAMEGALSGMSEQQRAQMKQRMPQIFGSDGKEQVALRIMGVDPEAERILRHGGLTIELPPFAAENADQMLSGRNDADISYHKNFGTETGFYASSHDIGTDATVAFDRLEITAGGGFAAGTFEGTLCPIRSLMGGNPDPEVCIAVTGRFETELGEEEADNAGPRGTN